MNWPKKFEENILQLFPKEAGYFFDALQHTPGTFVHLNRYKHSKAFSQESTIPWNVHGRSLATRPSFTSDPLFHAGAYYVQESSSQFLSHVLKSVISEQSSPVVLDLCAAPGGKTMHVLDALNKKGTLIANEIIKSRVRILEENLMRKGLSNVLVSHNDPADFAKLGEFFDVMVVDAPCSGEGLFRRDPSAAEEWSEGAVNLCAGRQQRILADVLPALKPGGVLIYATCTFNRQENEDNVQWLQEQFQLQAYPIAVPAEWNIVNESNYMFRFLPHKVNGEGLFMAVLQKPNLHETFGSTRNQKKSKLPFIPPKRTGFLLPWLHDADDFEFLTYGETIYALPKGCVTVLEDALYHLNIIKSGIKMGSIDKNQSLLPAHELALSIDFKEAVPNWELSKEEALCYLKKQVFPVAPNINKGWNRICYQGLGLGFAKVMPGRMNNYLPSELRIIKENIE
jgi:16S rRNA C967 or C1407 C5-methylase (RsmB/RsmF family)/NOL1/NOP2/fmu family ribosome biogenesis protein